MSQKSARFEFENSDRVQYIVLHGVGGQIANDGRRDGCARAAGQTQLSPCLLFLFKSMLIQSLVFYPRVPPAPLSFSVPPKTSSQY